MTCFCALNLSTSLMLLPGQTAEGCSYKNILFYLKSNMLLQFLHIPKGNESKRKCST